MSEKRNTKKKTLLEQKRLKGEVAAIRGELDCAISAFDNVTDPNLMDAYIYEISALRSRYNCAVKDLKAFFAEK